MHELLAHAHPQDQPPQIFVLLVIFQERSCSSASPRLVRCSSSILVLIRTRRPKAVFAVSPARFKSPIMTVLMRRTYGPSAAGKNWPALAFFSCPLFSQDGGPPSLCFARTATTGVALFGRLSDFLSQMAVRGRVGLSLPSTRLHYYKCSALSS